MRLRRGLISEIAKSESSIMFSKERGQKNRMGKLEVLCLDEVIRGVGEWEGLKASAVPLGY